jgi:hypothetical protein
MPAWLLSANLIVMGLAVAAIAANQSGLLDLANQYLMR